MSRFSDVNFACIFQQTEESSAGELGLANVGGVFLVLGVGVGIAVVVAFGELLWNLAVRAHAGEVSPLSMYACFS